MNARQLAAEADELLGERAPGHRQRRRVCRCSHVLVDHENLILGAPPGKEHPCTRCACEQFAEDVPATIAASSTILRATVGSNLHGLALEGTDDQDEMGVCLEPPEHVIGLQRFEQWVYRTQPEGARSGPGDLDLTVYSLRKWARLAAGGNPTVLLLLFAPPGLCSIRTPAGERLQASAPLFLSSGAGRRYLGYLNAQKQRLLGERGQMRVKRPELEQAHGFDTKYAMHILRLGVQGVELLSSGRLTLPLPEPERAEIMAVRRGERDLQAVLTRAGELEAELEDLIESSPLPPEPDRAAIDRLLIELYQDAWVAFA